jgi:hypothetical protein
MSSMIPEPKKHWAYDSECILLLLSRLRDGLSLFLFIHRSRRMRLSVNLD